MNSIKERFEKRFPPFTQLEISVMEPVQQIHARMHNAKMALILDFFHQDLLALAEEMPRKSTSDFYATITHADEELKKAQAVSMAIGYNEAISDVAALIRSKAHELV